MRRSISCEVVLTCKVQLTSESQTGIVGEGGKKALDASDVKLHENRPASSRAVFGLEGRWEVIAESGWRLWQNFYFS